MLKDAQNILLHLVQSVLGASRLTYASVAVGLVVAFLYFKFFFSDAGTFKQDGKKAYTFFLAPWQLLFRPGAYEDYQWSWIKVLVWVGLSVGCGLLSYHQMPQWFPQAFR